MKRVGLASIAVLIASACGVESEEGHLDLRLVATPRPDGDSEFACAAVSGSTIDSVHFARIHVTRESGDNADVMVAPIDGPGEPSREGLVLTVNGRNLDFDFKSIDESVTLDIELLDDACEPVARGHQDGARFGRSPVEIAMYPVARVGCIESASTARALHASTALPNGHVLIYGGVTLLGYVRDLDTDSEFDATMVAYLPNEARFEEVSVTAGASCESSVNTFERVLFASTVLPEEDDGLYRIRVTGGYDDGSGILFDPTGSFTSQGLPLSPEETSFVENPAPTVDLVYDPEELAVTIECDSERAETLAGYNQADGDVVLLGATQFDPDGDRQHGVPAAVVQWIEPGEEVGLEAGRIGATITRVFADEPTALVWGGNMDAALNEESVRASAGELVTQVGSLLVAIPEDDGEDRSVVLHSAHGVDESEVLAGADAPLPSEVAIAGGLVVGPCAPFCPDNPPIQSTLSDILYLVGADGTVEQRVATNFTPTILHASLSLIERAPVDGDTSRETVSQTMVMIGGLAQLLDPDAAELLLLTTQQVVRIRKRFGSGLEAEPLLDDPNVPGGLAWGRFGHAVAELPGSRLLVTGGIRVERNADDETDLLTTELSEVLSFDSPDSTAECSGP